VKKVDGHNLVRYKEKDTGNNLKYYRCEVCGIIYFKSNFVNREMTISAHSRFVRELSCKEVCIKEIIK